MAFNQAYDLRPRYDRHSNDGSRSSHASHARDGTPIDRSGDERAIPTTFVVDDDGIVRCDICGMLEQAGMRVQDFSTSEAFLYVYRPGHRDILLIDANLPGMSGLELLRSLKASGVHLTSIMVTGGREMALGVEAMKAGACDVIQKPFLEADLLGAVTRAHLQAGEADKTASWHEAADRLVATLTQRQLEIMNLVLAGKPSKIIAADLGISQRTVENHRAAIMRKAGSRSLPGLARLALGATA
jgi:two-component system CheB/CheR fusion protein